MTGFSSDLVMFLTEWVRFLNYWILFLPEWVRFLADRFLLDIGGGWRDGVALGTWCTSSATVLFNAEAEMVI